MIGIEIVHNEFKFKRITNISLGSDINFAILPEIEGKTKYETKKILPIHSLIRIITETKDSKRYLILRTTKMIEDYLKNRLDITYLPFDHK